VTCVTALTASALVAGCSAEHYRKQADADVYRIIRQRKAETIGYQPETVIVSEAAPAVPREAYVKTPETPMPPPAPAPIEPLIENGVPFGPVGPENRFAGLPEIEDTGNQLERTLEELRGEAIPLLYGPPAPRRPVNRFDLYRSLRYAVRNSRDYEDQLEDLYLAALDVTLERHLLGPRPFADAGLRYTGGQFETDYRSALTATAGAGVRQRLPYGGEIVAQGLVNLVNALNEQAQSGENAALVLSGSIPLLRGAGMINLEGLISSERELVYSVRTLEDFRRAFGVTIASQYFNLLARQRSVENRRQSLRDRERLLEQQQALFAAGRVTFLQVQRSEQTVLQAQSSVLTAQQSYQDAIDDFKIQIGMPVEEDLEVVPTDTVLALPDLDKTDAVELARTYRLDLQTARDRVEDAKRQVANANNGLLPELNLDGETRVGSLVGDPGLRFDSRSMTYSAGVTLDLPIDRVAERNAYRRALIGFQQSQRTLEETNDRVTADVRSAIRAIRSAQVQTDIALRAMRSAEKQIELSYELLKTGKADARDIVDAQNALLNAQDQYESAQVSLQVQVLQFLRDTGTLRVDPDAGSIGRALERVPKRERQPGDAGVVGTVVPAKERM
jgi:outer membrane protein TolC